MPFPPNLDAAELNGIQFNCVDGPQMRRHASQNVHQNRCEKQGTEAVALRRIKKPCEKVTVSDFDRRDAQRIKDVEAADTFLKRPKLFVVNNESFQNIARFSQTR